MGYFKHKINLSYLWLNKCSNYWRNQWWKEKLIRNACKSMDKYFGEDEEQISDN